MDTQTQIERLIELAIVQRTELKELVAQLPQLREHLSTEIEKAFDEAEPQLRAELEEWTTKQTADKTAALGVTLEAKIADLAKSLEVSTQARYNAIIAEREENARLAAQAEAKIAEHAASLPSAVKDIVTAELARFPRAGEIDQLRKEFAEPRGLNPRGKWQAGETYNKLDLVTINGDSYTSNTDGNRTRPSRSSADWTLVAARGTGGGGGPTSLSELTTVPSDGDLLIGSGTSWVTSNLTAGAGISITVGPGAITISATDGDITLDDGTAASPSLHFTNDPDTGIYRPAANTLGISTSGVQRMYVDENGITTVGAGASFDGKVLAANGNANSPAFSFNGDSDTGFFRHQANGIAIALGGTQYADFHSSGFSITPSVTFGGNLTVIGTGTTGGNLRVRNALGYATGIHTGTTSDSTQQLLLSSNAAYNHAYISKGSTTLGIGFSSDNGSFVADDSITITAATKLVTLAGNLTVSGRDLTLGSSESVIYFGTPSANYLYYNGSSLFLRVGSVDRITIPASTGNVLIGTTTDSSNGKLQLATHTTSAGGIGFGTDTALYRAAAQSLNLDGASSPQFSLSVSGTQKARFESYSDDLYISTLTAGKSIILRSGNGATALTLDSSQNATFAGSIKAASEVYAEKSGGGIAGQSVGLVTQFTTVNSTTYNVTTAAAKVFVVQLASGDAALCYASYKSSTITILGSDGTIVNSSSPTSTQLGIYKSANDHVISFKTGSNALAGAYGSWGFCFLGNPVISIA